MIFKFDNFTTKVQISNELPNISATNALFVCDENTKQYADALRGSNPVCVLKSGEENKNWESIEKILLCAKDCGLGRDSIFFGVGGGVIGDLTGFAASIYMRGCRLQLAATTLLSMVDAAVGGKTGFDLFDIKNLAGTFYPAEKVYMPLETLRTLPEKEYKSGMAELIKTAVLGGEKFFKEMEFVYKEYNQNETIANKNSTPCLLPPPYSLLPIIKKAVKYKGRLVEKDFKETKNKRVLLNLGHTFGHALEASSGLGNITHGEAVAWGIVQSCFLGLSMGISPVKRAEKIIEAIKILDIDFAAFRSLANTAAFKNALISDKKKKDGMLSFIVPNKKSAEIISLKDTKIIEKILQDGYTF